MVKCEQDKAIEIEATAAARGMRVIDKKQTNSDNLDAPVKDTRAVAAEGECEWSLEQLRGVDKGMPNNKVTGE